mmetsp:Transcript_15942/g.24658  ORF Transcript_15942/g.24658 Transcript_15942/m.24658 type:complete len:199 (-) Transcript_15942:512-1108(-)
MYVLDITNFEGSSIDEVFELINKGRHRVIFVINKIDAIPTGFKMHQLQMWAKKQLDAKLEPHIQYHICMSSAKMATGMLKVLEILEKWKKQMRMMKFKPKIYVMGATNSGKSSFLNSLLFKQQRKRNKKNQKRAVHKEKYNILTTSSAPGTTLDLVTIEEFKLGFRVIDTPGIPNLHQCSSFIKDYDDMLTVMSQKSF